MRPLYGKQLARNGMDMFLVSCVDAVAPLARLLVQILPTGKHASGKKIILDEVEGALDAPGTVGVADLVGHKTESEPLGEGFHLGHGNHCAARAAQHDHMRVVDHHPFGGAAHVA